MRYTQQNLATVAELVHTALRFDNRVQLEVSETGVHLNFWNEDHQLELAVSAYDDAGLGYMALLLNGVIE